MENKDKRPFDSCLINVPLTGICTIDITILQSVWRKKCFISQWHEDYFLSDGVTKVKISKKDAHEIIVKMDLIAERSKIFSYAITWKL